MLTLFAVMFIVSGFLLLVAEKKKPGLLVLAVGLLLAIVSLTGCTDKSQGDFTRDEPTMTWPPTENETQSSQVTAILKVEMGRVSHVAENGDTVSWQVDRVLYRDWNDAHNFNQQECTAIISENKTDPKWHRYGLEIRGCDVDNLMAIADSLEINLH